MISDYLAKLLESGHWDAEDFFCSDCEALGNFSLPTIAKNIFRSGLPSWVAPNIFLHAPILSSESFAVFGEDRNEREIMIVAPSGTIVANENGKMIYVASGLDIFIKHLILYADMVDSALKITGNRAVVDNKIPDECISAFESIVRSDEIDVVEGDTFWTEEIRRLRSHKKD
jgi:hypothetical protein